LESKESSVEHFVDLQKKTHLLHMLEDLESTAIQTQSNLQYGHLAEGYRSVVVALVKVMISQYWSNSN
jgi:hypothetical protein